MKRRLRRKLFIGIAAAAVVAGVTAAVVMAAQPGKHHHQRAHHARRAGARTSTGAKRGALAGAAAYLGVSTAQLHSELKGGESLAEIANATSGKSEAGLIAALEAHAAQEGHLTLLFHPFSVAFTGEPGWAALDAVLGATARLSATGALTTMRMDEAAAHLLALPEPPGLPQLDDATWTTR